jgi:CMP-N-acetylneuraminic acid synthetase
MLCGKPLIAWTIATALACPDLDQVVVSTDDTEIAEVAANCGARVPFLRPPELSQDDTPMWPVVRHAWQTLQHLGTEPEIMVLLQPTSPLRTIEDIQACLSPVLQREKEATMSVCAENHNPYFVMGSITPGGWQPLFSGTEHLTRRQDAPPAYRKTGSVYVFRERWLNKSSSAGRGAIWPVITPVEHAVDIDSELDLKIAAAILESRKTESSLRLRGVASPASE